MTPEPDPYRTLGIAPGASINEIRSAYRRLAKQHHPDAAGERALPRFLAIQAAYERLVDGEGRLRPWTMGGAMPREPWRADPARARASREAWRARGTPGGPAAGSTGSAPPGSAGPAPSGSASAGSAPPGSAGSASAAGERRSRDAPPSGSGRPRHGARRPTEPPSRSARKARPGSTTYDEAAAAPREPSWSGGEWYGPSSGTYWTINPREYADPRKHGPEYQARARRATGEVGPAGGGPDAEVRGGDRVSGPRPGPEPESRRAPAPPATPAADAAPPPALPDLEVLARRFAPAALLVLARRGDRRWRVLLAVVGWPPIGLALGSLLMETSGCGRFAAGCPAAVPIVAWLVQPLVVAALALLPVLAAVAAFGSLASLAVAVPMAAILAVGTVPESRVGAPVLAAALVIAWASGVAAAARMLWRPGTPPQGS
jgi:curved DNA-binding protein CbpA